MDNNEILKKNGGERFSIALGNPPYDRSLHLKFLEKTIEISDKVVFIQPVRWLEETVGPKKKNSAFNKYKESIADHIKDLDIYTAGEMEKEFGAAFSFNIGIYTCDKDGGYDYSKLNTDKIMEKVLDKMPDNIENHIEVDVPKSCITISLITGGNKGRNVVIDLYYWTLDKKRFIYDEDGKRLDNGLTFYENRKKSAWGNVKVREDYTIIKFNTIEECENFFDFTRTYLFRYMFNVTTSDVHVASKFLPFMNDYTSKWTDERLYDYFDITKEEQQQIENHIDTLYNEIKHNYEETEKTKKHKKK